MRAIKKWTLAVCLSLLPLVSLAMELQENQQYKVLPDNLATKNDTQQKEVIEFFSYACPACNRVHPGFDEWASKAKGVDVRRIPVVFHPTWEPLARAYYTAEDLGVLDKLNSQLFAAIHEKKMDLSSKENIRKIFVENGVKAEDFDAMFDSAKVSAQIEEGKKLLTHYQVMAVPTAVVNGKFVTDLNMTQSPEGFSHAIAVLVNK